MALGVAPCTKHEDCRLHADLAIACAIQEAGLLPRGRPYIIPLGKVTLGGWQSRSVVVAPCAGMLSPTICLPSRYADDLFLRDISVGGHAQVEPPQFAVHWDDRGCAEHNNDHELLNSELFSPGNDLVFQDIPAGQQLEFRIVNWSPRTVLLDGAAVRGFHMR